MGYEVEVTILSADGLEIVNWRHHSRLKPYAVVWVDPRSSKYATGVDERGGTCPRWDHKLEIPFNTPVDDSFLHIDVVHVESAEGTNQLVLVGSARLPLRDVDLGEPAVNKKLELTPRPSGSPHGNVDVKVAVRETRGYHAPDPYYGPKHKSNFGWKPKGCVPAGMAILRTLFGKIKLGTGERVAANDSLEDWMWVENPFPPERVVHVDKIHKEEAVQPQSEARETRPVASDYGGPSTTVDYDEDLEDLR